MNKKKLDQILGLTGSVFEAYSALLFLPCESSNKYRLSAHFTLSEHLKKNCILELGQGIVGWILRNNQSLLIDNFDQQGPSYYLGYYNKKNEDQIKSFMGCPLSLYQGKGALCLDSKQNYSFTRKDQQILQQFVVHLEELLNEDDEQSSSCQRDYYYSCLKMIFNLRWRYPRWKTYLEHFLKILVDFSGFKYIFLAALDQHGQNYFLEGKNQKIFLEDSLHYKSFSIDKGLIGWVFRNNTSITKTDSDNATSGLLVFDKVYKTPLFRSLICCPLIFHFRARGVLVLADEKNKVPSEEFNEFMSLISDHLSLFLENLYLKNKLKQVNITR